MTKLRTAFPWFGGKATHKIRNAILQVLPPHDKYVEPFGGGAAIMLGKEPVKVEVYNDVNRGLVNFFRVISDAEQFGRFIARATLLPASRELYEEYARTWSGIHDPVEQAIRWFVVARQSFSAQFGNSFGASTNSSNRGMAQTASSWRAGLDNLEQVHARMQRVQIECLDWRDCLSRYQGDGWLAYCDPPYVLGARRAGGYAHELQDGDHDDLIAAVLEYDGAIVLSGYDSPLYSPLVANGWDKVEITVTCAAAGRTKASGLQGDGKVLAKQKRTEVIWRNPEALKRLAES